MVGADEAQALFDEEFYRQQRPDLVAAGMDLWAHYQAHGWLEGSCPHTLFDPAHCRAQLAAGGEPFRHFLHEGWRNRVSPHPLFDAAFYQSQRPGLSGDAFRDYLRHGWVANASPHALFDPAFYQSQRPGLDGDPFRHYLMQGWREDLSPHPLFDVPFYLQQRPDIRAGGIEPLRHYVCHGWREGTRPHPLFDSAHYRTQAAPDEADLLHYLRQGEADGAWPNALFCPSYYKSAHAALVGDSPPLLHFVLHGEALDLPAVPRFRPALYRSRHLWDAPRAQPMRHALQHGATADDGPLPEFPPARPPAPSGPPFTLILLGPADGKARAATQAAAPAEAVAVHAMDAAALRRKARAFGPGPVVLVQGDVFVSPGDLRRLAAAALAGPAHPLVLDRHGDVVHAGYDVADGSAVPRGAGWDPAHPNLACARPALTAGPVLAVEGAALRRALATAGLVDLFLRASCGGRTLPSAHAVLPEAGHRGGAAVPVDCCPATPPRPRVLFIDATVPRAGHDGGSSYVLQLLAAYEAHGYDATVLPEAELSAPLHALAPLLANGVRVLQAPFVPSPEHYFGRTADQYAAVVLCRAPWGGRHMDAAQQRWPDARVLFHPIDLHHLRETRDAVLHGDVDRFAAALRTKACELRLAQQADATVVVSEHELAVLRDAGAGARAAWVPPERAAAAPRPYDPQSRSGVLFVGSYRHQPNLDAARWLCRAIWPRVAALRPGTPLLLAGSGMPDEIAGQAGVDISALGHVPDLGALLGRVRLTVAPLLTGAGIKLKLMDSLAAGVPAVCTSVAAEGTGLQPDEGIVLADSVDALAAAIVAAYDDLDRLRGLSAAGLRAMDRFAPGAVRARYWAATGVPPGGP